MTFQVDQREWRRLSGVAFRTSPAGRRGAVAAVALVAAGVAGAAATYAAVLSGAGGWTDPRADAPVLAAACALVGVVFAAITLRHAWYAANGRVGMLVDQRVDIGPDGTLTHQFRVRGEAHVHARNVRVARLGGEVRQATYDRGRGLLRLEGAVWYGLSPDMRGWEPGGPIRVAGDWERKPFCVIPDCFSPSLPQAVAGRGVTVREGEVT